MKTSPGRNSQDAEGDEDETPGKLEFQAIQERGSSLDRGYKPSDPVPIKEAWTEMIQPLQDSETVIKHRLSSGDTSAMEDS